MGNRTLFTWAYVLAAGWGLTIISAQAALPNYAAQAKPQETQYKTPEDMIRMVPLLGKIPRTFLFSDGTTLKLSTNQVRFDHRSRRRAGSGPLRTCMIGLSYTAAVGGSFSSEVHLPLFQSATLAFSDWSRTSLGDYSVSMTHLPADRTPLKLGLSARF